MDKILIGIHGMGNKPPPKTLRTWWKAPIREGLKRIGRANVPFDFELVYWAHFLYPTPLKPRIKDRDHPLYIEDPYMHAAKDAVVEKPSRLRRKILDYLEVQLEKIFLNPDLSINYESLTDFIVHHYFSDLEKYYRNYCVRRVYKDCRAKVAICTAAAEVLKKHRSKKILLIAHSMGSIVAYDVLTRYAADVSVDTLVTIGSPLGLPIIKSKIAAEHRSDSLKTPQNVVRKWYNLSDLRDKIALNYRLRDDYQKNAANVRPTDKIVFNDYEYMGIGNPHKSYGYLRTREMARIVAAFLADTDDRTHKTIT